MGVKMQSLRRNNFPERWKPLSRRQERRCNPEDHCNYGTKYLEHCYS